MVSLVVLLIRKWELKFCQSQLGNKCCPIHQPFLVPCAYQVIKAISSCFCLFLHAECGWCVFSPLSERDWLLNAWCLGLLMKGMRGEKGTRGLDMVILFVSALSAPILCPGQIPLWEGHLEDSSPFSCFEGSKGRKWVGWDLCITQDWRMLNPCLPGKWSHISC